MRLSRGENGTKILAPVEMGESVPTTKSHELPSVKDTIDTLREEAEAQIPTAVASPKERCAGERCGHGLMHMPYRSWCFSCVAGRGADDSRRKAGGYAEPPRIE